MTTVRSMIRFHVAPGREADFEAAFVAAGMLSRPRAVPGFVDAELSRSLATPGEYLVVARWASADAYRAWQEVSLIEAAQDALNALFETLIDPRPGEAFEVLRTSE
jgi:heme-degrading monooxygenase HmoA